MKVLKALSDEELWQLCKECNLKDIQCDIVYYLVKEELKDYEVYEKLGYSKSQYYRIKKDIKLHDIFSEI